MASFATAPRRGGARVPVQGFRTYRATWRAETFTDPHGVARFRAAPTPDEVPAVFDLVGV
jgi:hypothetical protein